MSDLDVADEPLADIAKTILIDPATDPAAVMFNNGVEAMRDNLVAGLGGKGISHSSCWSDGALITLVSQRRK